MRSIPPSGSIPRSVRAGIRIGAVSAQNGRYANQYPVNQYKSPYKIKFRQSQINLISQQKREIRAVLTERLSGLEEEIMLWGEEGLPGVEKLISEAEHLREELRYFW